MTRKPEEIAAELDRAQAELDVATDRLSRSIQKMQARSRYKAEVRTRVDALRAELAAARIPPESVAPIVSFQKQFTPGGKLYRYAAVKAGGYWFPTGARSPQGLSWRELIEFVRRNNMLSIEQSDLRDRW